MTSKQQKAVQFVEDFIRYGFRIDTTPTRMYTGGVEEFAVRADESQWWSEYVSNAEKRLREEARKVLE